MPATRTATRKARTERPIRTITTARHDWTDRGPATIHVLHESDAGVRFALDGDQYVLSYGLPDEDRVVCFSVYPVDGQHDIVGGIIMLADDGWTTASAGDIERGTDDDPEATGRDGALISVARVLSNIA